MLKTISLEFQDTNVDFLFYRYDGKTGFGENSGFHKHLNYELHIALKGAYTYEFSDESLRLRKNNLLIIPPGALHRPVCEKNGEYEFSVITLKISGNTVEGFGGYFNRIFTRNALKSTEIDEELANAVLKLNCDMAQGENDFLRDVYLKSCASDILYRLCAVLTRNENEKFNRQGEGHIDVLIENLVNNNMSLREIAERINYSPRQTERLIKKIYGKNLAEIWEDFK